MDMGTEENRNRHEVKQAKTSREAVKVMTQGRDNVVTPKECKMSTEQSSARNSVVRKPTPDWAVIDKRDNDLVFRAQHGDQRAYERLLKVYNPMIQKCCASLRGKSYGDDVLDLVWIATVKAVNSYDPAKGFSFTCHLNHSLSFGKLKGLKRVMQVAEREELFKDGVIGEEMVPVGLEGSTSYDTEHVAVGHMVEAMVDALVEELDEEEREIIYAIYYEGLSVAELAARKGISRQAMNKRRNSCVKKLRMLAKRHKEC